MEEREEEGMKLNGCALGDECKGKLGVKCSGDDKRRKMKEHWIGSKAFYPILKVLCDVENVQKEEV